MYSLEVTEIGSAVPDLLEENMLVLFGPSVPSELREICLVHNGLPQDRELLRVGGSISFGGQRYRIVELGDDANANFGGLGHLTIVFGNKSDVLPGSVRVEPSEVPRVSIGDIVTFE